MKVLVCGGRDFKDEDLLYSTLTELQITEVIEGGAKGADHLGHLYALVKGIPIRTFPAQWNKHGKAAGPIRNQQMLEEGKPDLVVAFPGGSGTADMVSRAREAGVKVIEVEVP